MKKILSLTVLLVIPMLCQAQDSLIDRVKVLEDNNAAILARQDKTDAKIDAIAMKQDQQGAKIDALAVKMDAALGLIQKPTPKPMPTQPPTVMSMTVPSAGSCANGSCGQSMMQPRVAVVPNSSWGTTNIQAAGDVNVMAGRRTPVRDWWNTPGFFARRRGGY